MAKAQIKRQLGLTKRQAWFDGLSVTEKLSRTRPGSMNRKKSYSKIRKGR